MRAFLTCGDRLASPYKRKAQNNKDDDDDDDDETFVRSCVGWFAKQSKEEEEEVKKNEEVETLSTYAKSYAHVEWARDSYAHHHAFDITTAMHNTRVFSTCLRVVCASSGRPSPLENPPTRRLLRPLCVPYVFLTRLLLTAHRRAVPLARLEGQW